LTSALLDIVEPLDLGDFFSRLHECRNKNDHVHGLHPYPAKFIPHIPRALLRALAKSGDVVLDPMCGSGTTLVEATVAGFSAVGVDLNPVATLVSRAKTTPLTAEEKLAIRSLAAQLEATAIRLREGSGKQVLGAAIPELPDFHNRDKWFEENVTRELAFAKASIAGLISTDAARDLALSIFSSIVVAVSNQESETRWCAKPKAIADGDTLMKLAGKLLDGLRRLAAYEGQRRAFATVHTADGRFLPIDAASVDLVITSPPYVNSHDYYLYNKLRMFWLGYDVSNVQHKEIGSRNRHSDMKEGIETYRAAMLAVLQECRRVTRSAGAAAVVVADGVIRGEFFDMSTTFDELAAEAGFEAEMAYRFSHRQFNSAFQRGFGTTRSKQTHVLVYRAV
jgi:DNA modification methylase